MKDFENMIEYLINVVRHGQPSFDSQMNENDQLIQNLVKFMTRERKKDLVTPK
jgi:translation initiation factor 2B subunit (eIF-2B alpha/beta/delta family)